MKQHAHNLSKLATIQSGIYCKSAGNADLMYLQARHFDQHGQLAAAELYAEVDRDQVAIQHLLQGGDVLFAAKGAKNFAALYEMHNPAAVASTTFFVIRLHTNLMLPAYLCWYLNHPEVLSKISAKAKGTNVPAISKAALADLKIILPPLEKQKMIIQIDRLNKRATALQEALLYLKSNAVQQQLFKIIETHV